MIPPLHITGRHAARTAAIYAGALACGFIGDWINLPLPWMIGAMVFASAVRLADLPVQPVPGSRATGQLLVAGSVGISFTPEAVAAMGTLAGAMVAVALLTVLAGFLVAGVLMRLAHVDAVTASLASIPMGPVESANLARRHGVDPGPVVFSQTLRIMALVVVIPPAMVAIDGQVTDPGAVLRAMVWSPQGAVLMFAAALSGALVSRALRVANPFFVGALAGSAAAAAFSLPVTAFPYPVLVLAQICLGVWLGAVFDRALLRRAGRFIPGAIVSSLLMIALCVAMGLGVAWWTGETWQTMVLSTAPGSVTEMALTAKILQGGAAVVTAFHLVRIFIILPFAAPIIGVTARLARRWGIGPDGRPDA